MSNNQPSSYAASAKVMADSIKTTFGAAIVVLFFFGLALILLVSGLGKLDSALIGNIVYLLIYSMLGILAVLFLLRIFKPESLGGPPQPETEQVSFSDSTMS